MIPQGMPRRYKSFKEVEFICFSLFLFLILSARLFHGNFDLNDAVPKKLLDLCPNRVTAAPDRAYTERDVRYSAATMISKTLVFTLRQVHYDHPPRRTERFSNDHVQ